MDGKISGHDIVIGGTGTVKGILNLAIILKLKTTDIDGYIKKTNSSKSKLTDP